MKRTQRLFRCIATILLLSFMLGTLPAFAVERSQNNDMTGVAETGTAMQMLTDRINTMVEETGETLTVSAIKELHDFAGNLYYLVEYTPTGYMICHGVYGNILEYSTSAPSPYSGYNDYLLYCGPTYYYYASKENVSHTYYMDEQISLEDTETLEEYESASNTMNMAEAENPSFIVTQTGTVSMNDDITQLVGTTMALEPNATPTGTKTYVGGASAGAKIKNLTTNSQMGYQSGGVCGYIASGLLLYWIDECAGFDTYVNDFAFIRGDHNGFIDGSLTRVLRSYGDSNNSDALGATGQDLKDILSTYASKNCLTISCNDVLFGTNDGVREKLIQNNKPILVCGLLSKDDGRNYDGHVVFAYGYTSTNQIIVHYGHSGYSEIVLCFSALGSYLELNSYGSAGVTMNDVSGSDWEYNAARYCARYGIIPTINGNFCSEQLMSRGDFVRALYNLAGCPVVTAADLSIYTDAPAITSPYYFCTHWAVSNGILGGDSATTLGLSRPLTREQAATFFYRFSNVLNCSYASTSGPAATTFSDYSDISSYARQTVDWATRRNLMNGDNGKLYPQRELTRAETAQFIYNLTNKASRS